ncbi:MAG: DUF5050 domain-containing protein, partial [Firmicutes bacterium]|nr:DUF5050 domain-containing protein [Bacillota bacterium]
MKRYKLLFSLIIVLTVVATLLIACENNNNPPTEKEFNGIVFEDMTVTYDGQEHSLTVSGNIPDGANVVYENNKGREEGTYNAKATVSCDGYKTLVLNAKLIINPDSSDTRLTFTGITLSDLTVDYDGNEHAVTVKGTLPHGATVNYEDNKGTNAGVYNVKATVIADGYKPLTLNAKLTINKVDYDMSGVTWNYSKAFTFDGSAKTVELTGNLPNGLSVQSYSGNTATDAGIYIANVTFDYDEVNYNAPEVNSCSWEINKANMAGLTLSNASAEYDSLPHGIQVVGNVPAGVVATYYYNDVQTAGVTESGEYSVRCVLSGKNYNSLTLTAKLTITSTEEQLFSAVTANGKIYFQNNLDDNKLYTVSGNSVSKVNNDIPKYMFSYGNELYYFSSSLFSKVIKNYDGSKASPFYAANGEYLTTDGTYVYYAINNTLFNTAKNGIYKLKLDGSDQEPIRLVTDKAEYLAYANGYIYYSNKSDGGKLYRVATSAVNANGTQLRNDKKNEKVSYIITDGTNLYFNSTKTAVAGIASVASAVTKYVIASGNEVKLTADSGKYLTKIGGDIYYVNNDKITSALFGDGIYKVSAALNSDSSLSGTKVLSAADNNGYSSLTSDGTDLYYYKLKDKHFYKNSKNGQNEVDLMTNYQVVDDTLLTGYSQLAAYNGEIYFTNPLDEGCLYKYNPATQAKYKVLADSVSNVSFYSYGGKNYMYYGTYILTNYALFRMDLNTNEIEKISSKRIENLIFEGNKICGAHIGAVSGNDIVSMNLDGSDFQVIADDLDAGPSVVGMEKINDTFYFLLNPKSGYRNVACTVTNKKGEIEKEDLQKAFLFVIAQDKIYYYADVKNSSTWLGFPGTKENALKVMNLDGSNVQTLVSNVDITY